MSAPNSDRRAVTEYRVPALSLKAGDLVNTAPGGEDDWQLVTGVWSHDTAPANTNEMRQLLESIGDRYVVVEMSDIAPVDSNVYFAGGVALAFGSDDGDDQPILEAVSDADARRIYLYTVHELVTVRGGGL